MSALDDWKILDAAPVATCEARATGNALRRVMRSLRRISPPDELERLERRADRFEQLSRRLAQQAIDKAARLR